jgi:hypothetical protein
MENPIPFNPETMTVKQLKECADALRIMFNMLNRGSGYDQHVSMFYHLVQIRDDFVNRWSK